MTVPHNLKRNAFLDNLGTDWVAVADNGDIVGRADSEAAVRQAVPHAAHFLNAAHLGDTAGLPLAAASLSATDAALEQIKAQGRPTKTMSTGETTTTHVAKLPDDAQVSTTPATSQPVAHTAKPPTTKSAKAHEPPAKTVKVPTRKVVHPPKHAGK